MELILHIIITIKALKIMVYPHHPLQPPGYTGCEGLLRSGCPVLVPPVVERWGEAALAGAYPSFCLPWVLPDYRCSVQGFVIRAPQPLEAVVDHN